MTNKVELQAALDLRGEAFMLSGYIAAVIDRTKDSQPIAWRHREISERIILSAYPIRAETELTDEPARVHIRTTLGPDFEIEIRPVQARG